MQESDPMSARVFTLERVLFAAFALLSLVPFWLMSEVPNTDGPTHVYNAFVHLHLHDPAYPQFGSVFELNPRPVPNWIGHAILLALLRLFAPATAEKILVSAYILLFLAAVRFLAATLDPRRRWLAWLALPFAVNWALHFGFYSFCYSLIFYLLAVALWWRGREGSVLRLAALLAPLLVLCYFAHVVSAILAIGSIGLLWLTRLPAAWRAGTLRRHLLHLPMLMPPVALILWFVATSEPGMGYATGAEGLWRDFWRLHVLFNYGGRWPGQLLGLTFLGLGLCTLSRRLVATEKGYRWRWQPEDAFLLLAAVLAGVYRLSPDAMSGGWLLQPRLILYPFLILIPWLAPPPARWVRPLVMSIAGLLTVWNLVTVVDAYRTLEQEVEDVVALSDRIEPGSRVLVLMGYGQPSVPGPALIDHSFDRAALARGLVDWSDYQASSELFPIRFQRTVRYPLVRQLIGRPELVDVHDFTNVDYVYSWKMLPGEKALLKVQDGFQLIARRGGARLYERKDRVM